MYRIGITRSNLFMLPFVTSDDGWMNELLKGVFICKEALGTLFGIGRGGMRALVHYVINHTLPINRNTGRVLKVTLSFGEM